METITFLGWEAREGRREEWNFKPVIWCSVRIPYADIRFDCTLKTLRFQVFEGKLRTVEPLLKGTPEVRTPLY